MSAKNKNIKNEKPLEEINVKLSEIHGISPRKYVPAAWILLILAVLFIILILPGLRKNGTYLTVYTFPPDSSVYVDGVRLGASGDELFIKKGSRKVLLRRGGFNDWEKQIDFEGKIFASLFFHKKMTLKAELKPVNPNDKYAYTEGIKDFALWVSTGKEQGRYAIPPSLTVNARDNLAFDRSAALSPEKLLDTVLPACLDNRHIADSIRASYILSSGGAPLNASSLIKYSSMLLKYTENKPEMLNGTLETISENLPENSIAKKISENKKEHYKQLYKEAEKLYPPQIVIAYPPIKRYGDQVFIKISGYRAPVGDLEVAGEKDFDPRNGAVPSEASVPEYLIGMYEVTNSQFAFFISRNPEWSPQNRENLIKKGLADNNYLKSWSLTSPPSGTSDYPVTEISWYAAKAYADWFTKEWLGVSGYKARLPYEDEWEIAARLNGAPDNISELNSTVLLRSEQADTGQMGIKGIIGNVREWCENPFRYYENRFRSPEGKSAYVPSSTLPDKSLFPESPVRGGSWIDKDLLYPAAVRGWLGSDKTSPVIGFRLALSKKSE